MTLPNDESLPSDVTADVTEAMDHERPPRAATPVSRFTPEQKGWTVAALVAFLGIAVVGPAWARAVKPKRHSMKDRLSRRADDVRSQARDAGVKARKKLRRLGGGPFAR